MASMKVTTFLPTLFLSLAIIASVILPTAALIPFPRPRSSIWDFFEDDPFRTILDQPDPFSISIPLPKSIATPSSTNPDSQPALVARADWKETPTSHLITIDVPGIKKEDLKIEMEEESRVLRVSGERKAEEEVKDDKWHRVERTCGKFWRQFRMPRDADVEKVKVNLVDGVLRISVPKVAPVEEEKKKKGAKVISIEDGEKKEKMLKDEMRSELK